MLYGLKKKFSPKFFFKIFFGGLECVWPILLVYVAHLILLRDIQIRTQSAAIRSKQARYQLSHPSP
jgi:hypothetical protein